MQIKAEIIADSYCANRITTFLVTAPRIILCEINTHKMISKNAASSRAIPVSKRIEQVRDNGFIPTFWGLNKPGMQASECMTLADQVEAEELWYTAKDFASSIASRMDKLKVHKSIANRIIEPYAWVSQLLTATEWGNFFNLRVDEAAQDEFHELAGQMLLEYQNSQPVTLKPGEWHVPFDSKDNQEFPIEDRLKVSAVRCARLSYEKHDGATNFQEDLKFAQEKLLGPGHMSPFEHSAQAQGEFAFENMDSLNEYLKDENARWDGENFWWGPYRNWTQFRKTLAGENREEFNAENLLEGWSRRRIQRGYDQIESYV